MSNTDRKPDFQPNRVLRASELRELTRMVIQQISGRDLGLTVRQFGDRLLIDDPRARPIAQLPYLYEVTEEAVDGIIEAKRIDAEGETFGDPQVFTEYDPGD